MPKKSFLKEGTFLNQSYEKYSRLSQLSFARHSKRVTMCLKRSTISNRSLAQSQSLYMYISI